MKIGITAGHGANDPGAVSGGFYEANFCADMRNYVAYYLRKYGLDVVTDGAGSTNAPLKEAIKIAKECNLAIEFHLNAAESMQAHGVEVLCSEKHKALAQSIAKAITSVTESKLRGDKGWRPENAGQHQRLGYVQAGGLIVELEFVTHKRLMNTLNDKRWVVAKAIAEAIFNSIK